MAKGVFFHHFHVIRRAVDSATAFREGILFDLFSFVECAVFFALDVLNDLF